MHTSYSDSTEVNLFKFVYRIFHEDFCSKINLYETVLTNADKLASVILCALNTLITCDSKTNLKSDHEIINPHIMLCDRCDIRDYNSHFNFSPG